MIACAPAHGALVPVSRSSEVRVSATVGTQTNSDSRQTMEFGTFDEAIGAGAVIAGQGTASASASQRSSIDSALGTFFATGGAAAAQTETGSAFASSDFTYRFGVTGADERVTFNGAIARTESGVVNAWLRDLVDPPDVYLLRRHVSEFPPHPGEPGPTWIEQFTLLSGHTYEVSFRAGSVATAGTTSFSGGFAIVLPGDFNNNGTVDAADYVVWRKTDGTQAGYNAWRSHFGQSAGSGSGGSASAAVPEPSTLVLILVATLSIFTGDAQKLRESQKLVHV